MFDIYLETNDRAKLTLVDTLSKNYSNCISQANL